MANKTMNMKIISFTVETVQLLLVKLSYQNSEKTRLVWTLKTLSRDWKGVASESFPFTWQSFFREKENRKCVNTVAV